METELRFDRAGSADIPRLRALAEVIWHASYASLLPAGQIGFMLAWMYAPERIAAEISAGMVWEIVGCGGREIGYLAWEFAPGTTNSKLHKLYLLPECQGRGLGQSCLRHVMGAAREAGALAIELGVNKRNARALKAYHRAGFETVDAVCTDIGGGFVMDDFILRRSLV